MSKTNRLKLCVLLVGTAIFAFGDDLGSGQFKGDLSGYNEVPAILTTGSGKVTVGVSSDQKSLSVTLSFTKLEGVAKSAGLYLGLPATTGGFIAPICGGTKPACPTTADGTATTTLTAADVAAILAQGLAAGDLASVIQASANGAVYVNIITDKFANGEIRGQLGRGFSFGVGSGRGH